MKLQCLDCKKQFLYAGKVVKPLDEDAKNLFVKVGDLISVGAQLETHVCPYCRSLNLEEVVEILPVVSVRSVDLSEVDNLLKEGYEVHELYAKTATLVKKAKKKEG